MATGSNILALEIPWTLVCQGLLSMRFSRHEYWSGLLFPSPGIFPTQGSNLHLMSPTLAGIEAPSTNTVMLKFEFENINFIREIQSTTGRG